MKKKYDWKEIQAVYNTGKTWKELTEIFGVNTASLTKAIKRGDFVSRNMSQAQKLSRKTKPRTLTQETKDKISKARKQFLKNNPDKVPYVLNHNSKKVSYAENYFKEALFGSQFKHKVRFLTYELDLAVPNLGINLEIDGAQHKLDKRIIAHDLKRNETLTDLGWKVIRVYWPLFQKLNQVDKEKIVKSILELKPFESEVVSLFGWVQTEFISFNIHDRNKCPSCQAKKSRAGKVCLKCHSKQRIKE